MYVCVYVCMYIYINYIYIYVYRVVLGYRYWQIETAGRNWAGFFTEGLETRWQRFGQFLNDL